jgi:hypothetical protein
MKALSFAQVSSLQSDLYILYAREKLRYDTVRPQSAIRFLFGDRKVAAWAGPMKGTQQVCGNEWVPYLATHSSSEYPSGGACLALAFGEWAAEFIGTTEINLPYSFRQGCSRVETGVTPRTSITGVIKTVADLGRISAKARVDAGVHFPIGADAGLELCKGLAAVAYKRLQKFLD